MEKKITILYFIIIGFIFAFSIYAFEYRYQLLKNYYPSLKRYELILGPNIYHIPQEN